MSTLWYWEILFAHNAKELADAESKYAVTLELLVNDLIKNTSLTYDLREFDNSKGSFADRLKALRNVVSKQYPELRSDFIPDKYIKK